MSESTKGRVRQILNDCCAGNASLATDILHGEFILIPRSELPDTWQSTNGNGICASSAQEFHQPGLYFHPADGDKPGDWNRKIAYANLAVAEAVEAKIHVEEAGLDAEAHEFYSVYATARGIVPMSDWETVAGSCPSLAAAYRDLARHARTMYGKKQ